MEYKNIILHKSYRGNKHVNLIQLNRPKQLNALCTPLMKELAHILQELDGDTDTRVNILTGNEKAFAAGADIAEMEKETPVDKIVENRFKFWDELNFIKKPLIASVNGYALGGGCELAMVCNLILCSNTAKFGQPEISIGTIPGAGGTQRLTKALGKSKSMYYVLTGDMIDAQQALEWGLVAKVFPSETLLDETFEVAKKIANKSPIATQLAVESINQSFEMPLKSACDYERRNFYLTFSTEDQKEGMRAFLEKRTPEYKGK